MSAVNGRAVNQVVVNGDYIVYSSFSATSTGSASLGSKFRTLLRSFTATCAGSASVVVQPSGQKAENYFGSRIIDLADPDRTIEVQREDRTIDVDPEEDDTPEDQHRTIQ